MFAQFRNLANVARILWRAAKLPAYHAGDDAAALYFGTPSHTGINVSPDLAMQISAVWACNAILSKTIASLPLIMYERGGRNGEEKRRAVHHPLYRLMHDAPNEFMTSYTFRQMMQTHINLRGNAVAQVVRDAGGRVRSILPWPKDKVRIEQDGWMLRYQFETLRGPQTLQQPDVLHIPNYSMDGLIGLSPIQAAMRDAVGLAYSADKFASKFFVNGAASGITITVPGNPDDDQRKAMRESWLAYQAGLENAQLPFLATGGAKIDKMNFNPEEMQFMELRKFQVREIARIFGVPLHLIGDLEKSSFNNIEHQQIEFVVHTIRPILRMWEQQLAFTLLIESEREQYFFEFLVDELLRGDVEARNKAYSTAKQNGWLNTNEIRARENMNPVEGGDEYWRPANMDVVGRDEPENDNASADRSEQETTIITPHSRLNGVNGSANSNIAGKQE